MCEGSDQWARFASKLALTCDLCEYKKFEMSSPRTQFSDKKNVAYEVNPRMVVFSHESSIGDNQVTMTVCEGSDQWARFASKLALTCDLCEYKKFEMSSPRTQFSDKKNVAYEVNPRMVVFSHESSIGDNQVTMMLGIQAHGDDDFVPSFSVTLLFVAYFQLKIPKALVVIKIQL